MTATKAEVDPLIDEEEVEQARQQKTAELEGVPDWEVLDFMDLRDGQLCERGQEVIEGFMRDGEVGFIGSVSKAGKSWLVGFLIWCVVTGSYWLGLRVKQGKVLLVDNELKRREIDWRHTQICKAMQFWPERDQLKVICRRGKGCDIQGLAFFISQLDLTGYSMIVIDAIYKIIPDGKSENDNEAMGKLMNALQGIAEVKGVAIMCVHHATKGDQSHKSTLDILAGAGSFGRSLDAMVAIRDHEQDGLNVAEFKARTNKDPEPVSIKFDFPLWQCVTTAPEVKQPKRVSAKQQEETDKRDCESLLESIPAKPKRVQQQAIIDGSGFGVSKCKRLIGKLLKEKLIHKSVKTTGKIKTVYYSRLPTTSENASESASEKF